MMSPQPVRDAPNSSPEVHGPLPKVQRVTRSPSRVSARRHTALPRRPTLIAVVLAIAVTLLAGCATFQDTGARQWHDKPQEGGPLAAPPRVPDQPPESEQPAQPPGSPGGQASPNGCVDPDPQVVATCLNPVSAIAVMPDAQSALVAERATGQVFQVQKGKPAQLVSSIPVDAASGGLISLVLSPSYDEDQLLYAYIATPADHRVVRIAPGDPPVPVLTGIPRSTGSDAGALAVGRDGALLVATGSAGGDNGSLAGKLLRIDTFGHPLKDNPNPASPIYSSGLQTPGGLCVSPTDGTVFITDHLSDRDVLYQATPGQLGTPAWSWPDRPGVAGCTAPPGAIAVAERTSSALFLLHTSPQGGFTGVPQTMLAGTYGRLGPATLASDGLIWLGTNNKGAGGPIVSSDDRVIRIQPPSGGSGSGPD